MAYEFDQAQAVALMKAELQFKDQLAAFRNQGITAIREAGIKGGRQEKEIMETADNADEKLQELEKFAETLHDDIATVCKNYEWFDEELIMNQAAAELENVQKSGGNVVESASSMNL